MVEPEPEPPVGGSTGGVPEGTEGGELELDERLLESSLDGESGSDDLLEGLKSFSRKRAGGGRGA